MFRTRDFVLVLSIVVFLIMGIGATYWNQTLDGSSSDESIKFSENYSENSSAEVYTPETISREDRLLSMRQKIAESKDLVISESEPEEVIEVQDNNLVNETILHSPQKCNNYSVYNGNWPLSGVIVTDAEGALVAYKNMEVESSSSTNMMTESQKEILLQINLGKAKTSKENCIVSDVIGVAKDGSLIRNNEANLYSIFGEDVLIGYALDGHPIYGLSTTKTDKCGGIEIYGNYRYFLSANREAVLNCFVSIPVALPN